LLIASLSYEGITDSALLEYLFEKALVYRSLYPETATQLCVLRACFHPGKKSWRKYRRIIFCEQDIFCSASLIAILVVVIITVECCLKLLARRGIGVVFFPPPVKYTSPLVPRSI